MGGTGAAVSVDAEVQQMVVSIHEVVQRSFEDTEDSSGSGTLKQESLSRSRQSHRRSGSSYNSSSNSSSSSGNQ